MTNSNLRSFCLRSAPPNFSHGRANYALPVFSHHVLKYAPVRYSAMRKNLTICHQSDCAWYVLFGLSLEFDVLTLNFFDFHNAEAFAV